MGIPSNRKKAEKKNYVGKFNNKNGTNIKKYAYTGNEQVPHAVSALLAGQYAGWCTHGI